MGAIACPSAANRLALPIIGRLYICHHVLRLCVSFVP